MSKFQDVKGLQGSEIPTMPGSTNWYLTIRCFSQKQGGYRVQSELSKKGMSEFRSYLFILLDARS